MQIRNEDSKISPDEMTSASHGRQGVDKAPGEETPNDTEQTVEKTQKGKNKVDGDPSKESDRPIRE